MNEMLQRKPSRSLNERELRSRNKDIIPKRKKTIPEGALSCSNGSQNRGIDAYLAKTRQEDEGARSSLTQADAAHAPPHAQTESRSFEGT